VQVAIGLGRESRLDDGVAELLGLHVFNNALAEKIGRCGSGLRS
jgi:hypothetical protein